MFILQLEDSLNLLMDELDSCVMEKGVFQASVTAVFLFLDCILYDTWQDFIDVIMGFYSE